MSNDLPNFIIQFNNLVEESQIFLSIARASELQQEVCENLESVLSEIAQEKKKAIENNNEDYANLLLGCECVTKSLLNELQMWLLLKQEKPEAAWNYLVDAQMKATGAAKAHDGFRHLEYHRHRLEIIEKRVFPPQVFLSVGAIVHEQECSICGEDYDECEHFAGKPYMGEFCHVIIKRVSVDHLSIVETPASKRHRVTSFDVAGGARNKMTWKIEKSDENTSAPTGYAKRTAKIAIEGDEQTEVDYLERETQELNY